MKDPSFYVSSLLELADSAGENRKALFRQAMTALARVSHEGGPGPLDGLRPDYLAKNVQAAIVSGIVDDLDFLAPAAAGIALYTLASALPSGHEKRELGRRILARMHGSDAATFTAIVTAMAQSSGKGLSTPAVRARIALVCELPLSYGIADGPLALALLARRELAKEWVAQPSTRSMPSRRFAAKIIERAAREAAKRAQAGDQTGLRVFANDAVRGAFNRLLADREPLVWRYVAIARGLCAAWVPALRDQIVRSLTQGVSPAEWRRASASLAAYGAVNPVEALALTQAVVKREIFAWEDPASASAFVWGITRTIEAEPEAAAKMLGAVLSSTQPEIAEAIAELRYEHGPSDVVTAAEGLALDLLKRDKRKRLGQDDGAAGLFQDVARDLDGTERDDRPLRMLVAQALDAFVNEGAAEAYTKARESLVTATGAMDTLEAVASDDASEGKEGELARRTSMAMLRDLDMGLLERNAVADLLRLGTVTTDVQTDEATLDGIRERFAEWVVTSERSLDSSGGADGRVKQATLRLRRLRALLHLVDGEIEVGDAADTDRAERLRALWLKTVRSLLVHFDRDPAPVLRRTVLAALARALDALAMLDMCDVADAVLVLASRIKTTKDFAALPEASLDPDLRHALARYAAFLKEADAIQPEPKETPASIPGSIFPPSDAAARRLPSDKCLKALHSLAEELATESSARVEAIRTVLVRLNEALAKVASAVSLHSIAQSGASDDDLLEAVETWVNALSQMCVGARTRIEPEAGRPAPQAPRRQLSVVVSRVVYGVEEQLTLGAAIDELVADLPHGIDRMVAGVLWCLAELPIAGPEKNDTPSNAPERLPVWLPARRTIGGYYVVRSLGTGANASVLVVNRVEDRNDPNAEKFALKVPEYNVTAAQWVSEEQFLQLFREEASALIMLPNHANLARFVTFDLSARPFPILVMELVEGATMERVIEKRSMDTKKCLKLMDDILAGLQAMHEVNTGHLDLKPSNVLLRKGEQAVLVDFGLSGRRIRLGCGTGPYGAPEIWGLAPAGTMPTPMAADIYSFACLAYEMLTGNQLFAARSPVEQVQMHDSHDGSPEPIKRLMRHPEIGPLGEVLMTALRHHPRDRPSAADLRREIRAVSSMVSDAAWPVV